MHRKQKWTGWQGDLGCRASVSMPACTTITGPMFFVVAAPYSTGASVRFQLLDLFIEKSNLGMRKLVKKSSVSKGTIRFDEQYRYQVDVGYVTARQKALELAMAVDEDCVELGIDRSPKGVASWGDDRRPPLFWVNPDIDDSRVVLMYECRHFFEDDCEQLPSTLHAANELLVNAHDVYSHMLFIKFLLFRERWAPS